mgnify:FL=1
MLRISLIFNCLTLYIMAIAIRPIPTLYGEDAERFERLALEAEKRTAKLDITDNIRLVKEFLKKQNW